MSTEAVRQVENFFDALPQNAEKLFAHLNRDIAIKEAEAIPGAAVVGCIDDCILVEDCLSTGSSKILENFVPPYGAEIVGKLRANSVLIVARDRKSVV